MSSRAVVTRFAPSPTGLLHLGHAYAAHTAWRAARREGGRFLVRLEDIDPQRCKPEFAAAALEDLAWLGLGWDGAVRVQSAHMDEYKNVLEGLAARRLLYPCFCSRAEVAREAAASAAAPHGPTAGPDGGPLYPGTCRRLGAAERDARLARGEAHSWRLDMAAALDAVGGALRYREHGAWVAADPAPFGDVVLGRRDAPASYHLCVTHDDALQGVTLVTRGDDLAAATHVHVLLQRLMGWATPDYAHHRLLAGADGARLAKRHGAVSLREVRALRLTPEEVLRRASCVLASKNS
jgi:glutamyl-Q tRNA(Asp) synthetase